jgi:serine/threonine protein kinase
VVDLFDCGVTGKGHPYLIMELCASSYAERMRDCPLSAAEARDVGVKIADALADSHHLGVLHRDVKPANLLLTRFGEPALADFGLAVLAEARDPSITLEVLTPAYAAPEMFQHGAPSPAGDVYALCATLYTVMSGKPPRWREDRDPSLLTLMELFALPVPDIRGVPAALMDVLRAGMVNDPEHRPSAATLRDMLAEVSLDPRGATESFPVSPSAQYYPWPATTPPSPVSPGAGPDHDGPTSPLPDGTPTVPNARRRGLFGKLWRGDSAQAAAIRSRPDDDR